QMMTVAAVDRLVHHATIIEVCSDSYRRKEALGRIAGVAATVGADVKPAQICRHKTGALPWR
ncbi:MAG: ATP-binding protein, partial [Chromatiaceae bacterium]